jgi:hypothetical protein
MRSLIAGILKNPTQSKIDPAGGRFAVYSLPTEYKLVPASADIGARSSVALRKGICVPELIAS